MEPVTALLGYAVGKAVFKAWFKDNEFLSSAAESATDMLRQVIGDRRARTSAERQIARIGDRAVDLLEPLIEVEWSNLPPNEKLAATYAIQASIDQVNVNSSLMAKLSFDPDRLSELVIERANLTHLSRDAKELAKSLAFECSQLIVDVATSLPDFQRETYAELLRRETTIIDRVERTFEAIEVIKESAKDASPEIAYAKFEEHYRRSASRALDQIELFGLDARIHKSSKQHNLSTAYISLSVSENKNSDDVSNATNGNNKLKALSSISAEEAARLERLVVIKGEAGSGKTTLLQSLAVRSLAARFEGEMAEWNGFIPFFVRLRALESNILPRPEELPKLVVPNIAGLMPLGWVHSKLEEGKVVLLIDGLDEVATARRDATRRWIASLLQDYPETRIVVTTRPPAIPDGWLHQTGFKELELLPMTPDDVRLFVDHWHETIATHEQDAQSREEVLRLAPLLKERLRTDRDLRELAATPLLCAMLCAMNRDKKQVLPTNRIALYDAAVQMILHGRDEERLIRLDDLPRLEYETKRALIQEIALWMMQNGESMADAIRVEQFISRKLPIYTRLQEGVSAKGILDALILRSGILRSPIEGKIDFIHNAFKEFLCARAVVSGDHLGFVKTVLNNEAWREVAAMAAAMADAVTRAHFINDLLAAGDKHLGTRARYHLLALRCLETCIELSAELQREIKDRLKGLSPPSNISEARALSAAGDMALPLLRYNPNYYAKTAAACVRGLRMIGTPESLGEIAKFASDERATIAKEVASAWPYFDTEEYARIVLSQFVGVYGSIQLFSPDQFNVISHLKNIRSIYLQARGDAVNNKVLEEVSRLDQLSLVSLYSSNTIDIALLKEMPNLRTLFVNSGFVLGLETLPQFEALGSLTIASPQVASFDLSQLPSSLIDLEIRNADLELHQSDRSIELLRSIKFSGLRSLAQLGNFGDCVDMRVIEVSAKSAPENFHFLSNFGRLFELNLTDVSGLRTFKGLENCIHLRSISVKDCVTLESIEGLDNAKRLLSLDLSRSRKLDNPSELSQLRSLHTLSLTLDDNDDFSFLFDLPNLRYLHVVGLSLELAKGLDQEIRTRNSNKPFRMRWQVGKTPL